MEGIPALGFAATGTPTAPRMEEMTASSWSGSSHSGRGAVGVHPPYRPPNGGDDRLQLVRAHRAVDAYGIGPQGLKSGGGLGGGTAGEEAPVRLHGEGAEDREGARC